MFNLKSLIKYSGITGVLRSQTASYLYGMSTKPLDKIHLWSLDTEFKSRVYDIVKVENLELTKYKEIKKGLHIVTPEEAIIGLIVDNIEDQFIYESLDFYSRNIGEPINIGHFVSNIDLKSKVLEYVSSLDSWMNDFYKD